MLSGIDLLKQPQVNTGLELLSNEPIYRYDDTFDSWKAAQPYLGAVSIAEQKYGLPKNLLANMIHTESRFNPAAVGPKTKYGQAKGIAQIISKFHPDVDPLDANASIDYMAKYVKKNYTRFGSWDKAIAAYNAGPTNVAKLGMDKLPKETQDYSKKINASRTWGDRPKSGLDLLVPKAEEPPVAPVKTDALEEPKQPQNAELFYGSTAVSPPFQGLAPFVWTPALASHAGKMGFGPKPEGGWDELGVPLNKKGEPYYQAEKATGIIAETLQGMSELATHPLEVVRGGLDFFLSIPGFLTGMISAAGAMGSRTIDAMANAYADEEGVHVLNDLTLEDLYKVASEEMQKSMAFYEPGKHALVGEPTKESQLATQVVMAPMTALSMAGNTVADWDGFKAYPNIRGAARFAGDITGLITMGMLLHGGSRGEFTKGVEEVVKEAADIRVAEEKIKDVPNEVLKQAQQAAVEAKKAQLDLKAKKLQDQFSGDLVVREELARQAEEIAKAKMRPVAKTGLKKPSEAQVKALEGRLPEGTEPEFTFTSQKGNEYVKVGDTWYKDNVPITNHFVIKAAENGKVKAGEVSDVTGESLAKELGVTYKGEASGLEYFDVEVPLREGGTGKTTIATKGLDREALAETVENTRNKFKSAVEEDGSKFEQTETETITNVDQETGISDPVPTGEQSPFYQDAETTEAYRKIYEERAKSVDTDPEIFTQKLINDANRWEKGDDSIDIDRTRKLMSMLGEKADELRGEFLTGRDHFLWKETVDEAAKWLRDLDRSKIERTITVYRRGRKEGRWWTTDKEYADIFGKGRDLQTEEVDISNLNLLDTRVEKPEFLNDLVVSMTPPITVDKVMDRALTDHGYDGFIGSGESGEPIYYFVKDRSKIEPTDGGTKLYSGIPVDLAYERMKRGIVKLIEEIKAGGFEGAAKNNIIKGYELLDKDIDMGSRWLVAHWKTVWPIAKRNNLDRGPLIVAARYVIENGIESEGLNLQSRAKKLLDRSTGNVVDFNRLYANISPKEIIKSARGVMDYMSKARGMKAFKPKQAAQMLREEFNRSFIDRSGNIRKELLDKLGEEGYNIVQGMYLSRGSSSMAANALKQMRKEVYHGLTKPEKKILDGLILSDRMIDIAKYKTEKEFKFPKPIEDFVRFRQAYKYEAVNGLKNLSSEKARILDKRAKAYFEWMKKPLKDMLDAELITQEEHDALAAHNYRRVKLVEVYDNKYKTKVGAKKRTVYDSGVESLARGRDTDIYEPSSEVMALEVFNRAYGRILNNKANQTLLELARKDNTNPFVRVKETKQDMIPTGWNRIFVYDKGQRKAMYLSPEMSKEWITTNPDMSYRMSQLLRYSSGSPVLRTFATGINWGFALANLPRDVMHTWYAARVFEGSKWKPIYSSHAPIFAMQIGRDLTTSFSDALLRKGRYEKYIEEGGGMEFLVHQGRLFQRGRHLEGSLDAIYNFMGYFGETSEIMTRLAIRERVMRRRARDRGISFKEAREDPKVRREATFAARDYMDFGQGGWATKAVDNAIPYLNAGVQGNRGLWRAFKDNPVRSTYKLAQFGALVTGAYIAAKKLAPKTHKALRGNIDMQNNLVIPLGDDLGFEDERGQMRYPYLKIPLDPSQRFFKSFFEASTDKWLGDPVDVNQVVDSLKQFSPVGVTEMPPSMSGAIGYITNKDFWLNEDIWRKTDKPFDWPVSKEEYIPGRTPQAYIDFGKVTGMSPERTRYAVEELTTNGTMWSWLMGKAYDANFGDLPKSQKEQHLADALRKTPVIRRFFGVTNPYSQFAEPIRGAKQSSDLDKWIQNRGLDALAEGYLFKDNVKKSEIKDYIRQYKDVDIVDRLTERFEFQLKTRDLQNRSFWLRLRGLDATARAKVYLERLNQSSPEEEEQLRSELAGVIDAGGVVTDSFMDEVSRLRREQTH